MANEAVCYETPTKFARYTVADGTGISKGTLLKLSSPNTAAAAGSYTDKFAGVAWMEKVANDGSTEIVAAIDGVWGLVGSNSVTVGQHVSLSTGTGSNFIQAYTTLDFEKGYVVGKALQTGSGTVKVRLL